ncbi:MAG: peptidoglycan-associated lipoprotein Pal, partial [bacterium]
VSFTMVFGACVKKTAIKKTPVTEVTEAPQLPEVEETQEPGIRGADFSKVQGLETITFDFDRYFLADSARAILQKNADMLKLHKDWEVLVEGHCDERGTIEYNLALGQKRAKEVREYYMRLGVKGASVGTISYGEEKPVCEQATEECWMKNRRAETKVRLKAAVPEKK